MRLGLVTNVPGIEQIESYWKNKLMSRTFGLNEG